MQIDPYINKEKQIEKIEDLTRQIIEAQAKWEALLAERNREKNKLRESGHRSKNVSRLLDGIRRVRIDLTEK